MQTLRYVTAIGAQALLLLFFWVSVLLFTANPVAQVGLLAIGSTLILLSAWQSLKAIRAGEPLVQAVCWLSD